MLPKVLFQNMSFFFMQMLLLTIEAVNCLETAEMGYADKQATAIDQLRGKGRILFERNEQVT
jgi:hypothetical protein